MSAAGIVVVDDRDVAYVEVGDPTGPLVLHNHGGPSSRLEAELFDSAATGAGVRLVCVDRPGIGRSDPQPGRTFQQWATDLLALADAFDAPRFAVTGWSEDGPWALAAAAYLDPERLVHVSSISGASYGTFGANWAADHQSRADAIGGRLALHFRPGFTLMYELLELTATHFEDTYTASLLKAVCAADRDVLADDRVLAPFLAAGRECFRQGASGLVDDATLLYRAWPFDVAKIQCPVHLWQGGADTLVPPAINEAVAKATPGAVWHPVPSGGHFIAVSHAGEILGSAADDLGHVHAQAAQPGPNV